MLDIRSEIVDLLANGPSSFAALYGFLAREGIIEPNIDQAWRELERLEQDELIQASWMSDGGVFRKAEPATKREARERYRQWLGSLGADALSVDAVSLDEVGLWYSLTDKGVALARAAADHGRQWVIDWSEGDQVVTIYAQADESARRALDWWLQRNPSLQVDGSPEVEVADSFRTRSGIEFAPAVRLTAQLAPKPNGGGG